MILKKSGNINLYQFESFIGLPIKHGIFLRHGGCSPKPFDSLNLSTTVGDSRENVIRNRNSILTALNIDDNRFFDVWQVHSSKVIMTDRPRNRDENYLRGDAIITKTRNIALLMRFADCVPILLMDPVNHAIGIVHAGWIGTLNKIVQKTVRDFINYFHSDPKKLRAGIGPSIGVDHYEIGKEVADKAQKVFPKNWNEIIQNRKGSLFLDLWKANESSLQEIGVEQIEIAGICTVCHIDDFFSHRGENGKTGRFGALISLNE